ncbi:hypothetical protein L1887_52637 [Cichorium endivia]|nr:hypothetical protein L1887_52637 [Cichorium endivia]
MPAAHLALGAVFKGADPIQLCHLVTRPAHSIINQAFDSRLRLDATRAVNGDGFGVGWYDSTRDAELGDAPCIFTSVTPAWNNQNLQRIAEKIKSPLVFAHVRASTAGALSETNCHPWRYGRLMWMHNGQISDFSRIKRRVLAALPEPLFLFPQGVEEAASIGALDGAVRGAGAVRNVPIHPVYPCP